MIDKQGTAFLKAAATNNYNYTERVSSAVAVSCHLSLKQIHSSMVMNVLLTRSLSFNRNCNAKYTRFMSCTF